MCVKCERFAKRFPAKRFGKVKFWAGFARFRKVCPIWLDKRLDVGIEAHISRIEKAISLRKYKYGRYKEVKDV